MSKKKKGGTPTKESSLKRELRSPKYKMRTVPNKKKYVKPDEKEFEHE